MKAPTSSQSRGARVKMKKEYVAKTRVLMLV